MNASQKPSQYKFDALFKSCSEAKTVGASRELLRDALQISPLYLQMHSSLSDGETLLLAQVGLNTLSLAKYLLEAGADPNLPSLKGVAPLHKACRRGMPEMVQLLLDHGAKSQQRDFDGDNSLQYALARRRILPEDIEGNEKVVGLLLAAGTDPLVCDKQGLTPLHVAADKGLAEHFHAMLRISSPRAEFFNRPVTSQGINALHFIDGKVEAARGVLQVMLDAGANPMQTSWIGRTVLHSQAQSHECSLIHDFVKLGVDVNAQDAGGNTALHLACEGDKYSAARELLSAGADPEIANVCGVRPMDMMTKLAKTSMNSASWREIYGISQSSRAFNAIKTVEHGAVAEPKPL